MHKIRQKKRLLPIYGPEGQRFEALNLQKASVILQMFFMYLEENFEKAPLLKYD